MYWITCMEGGPRRVNHAAAAVGKYIYSFGGYCTGEDSKEFRPMDVHVLNIETLRWCFVPLKQIDSLVFPFQRYGHTAIAYNKNIYIWGGRNDETACNTLYYFDTTSHCWHKPKVKGEIPGAKDGHSACLNGHQMYIFGGFEEDEESFSQDVYVLDLKELCWSYVTTLGNPPSYRDFHSAVVLKNRMYIFGGRGDRIDLLNQNDPTNASEKYSPSIVYLEFETGRWHRPFAFGDIPTGRRSHSAFIHNGYMYIFGGYNGNLCQHYNEMYRFNPETSEWKLVKSNGIAPSERRRQACVVVADRMYLFGGTSPNGNRRDSVSSDESDYNVDTSNLMDHNDLHVFDFNPTLRCLSMLIVIRYNLDISCLPASLQFEIKMMTTPNKITTPLEETIELLNI